MLEYQPIMANQTTLSEPPELLPPELYPCVEHLVTEDNKAVDSVFSEKQMRLLTEPLFSSWQGRNEGRKFVAFANVGLFCSVLQPPYVPDMLLSLDVELPADVHPKAHRSYFMWLYGKPPDIVVEIVSNKQGSEDIEKLAGYARIGVPYYVIHDPDRQLSERAVRAYQLEVKNYRPIEEPIWFPEINLGLRLWQGRYEDLDSTWLRWVDVNGEPVPSGSERAEQERIRAEQEHTRAEQEHTRAEQERVRAEQERMRAELEREHVGRLTEQLRRLGAEPEV